MPQNCCVPGCPKAIGGHLFPRDPVPRQQWIVAVRRVDPNNAGKLWQPSQYSVVYHHHFVSSDYMDTILGEQMLLIFFYISFITTKFMTIWLYVHVCTATVISTIVLNISYKFINCLSSSTDPRLVNGGGDTFIQNDLLLCCVHILCFIYLFIYLLHGLYRTLSHSQSEESQVIMNVLLQQDKDGG